VVPEDPGQRGIKGMDKGGRKGVYSPQRGAIGPFMYMVESGRDMVQIGDPKETPVKDVQLEKGMSVAELMDALHAGGGFSAKHLTEGQVILKRMFTDGEMVNFLSFPACIMATGCRGALVEIIKQGWVDVIITTCGTVDHDLARTYSSYYHGEFMADDDELYDKGVNRLGNVYVPNECYGPIVEGHVLPFMEKLMADGVRGISTSELLQRLGESIDDERSLLHWTAKKNIPVFLPGPLDGSFGSQLWMYWQNNRSFFLDLFTDQQRLSDFVFEAKSSGALMIGGGISKHHVIWWNQFRDGLDEAVYITTAVEHDGSLSGARVREAVSWGKVRQDAHYRTVEGDATLLLPILVASLLDSVPKRK